MRVQILYFAGVRDLVGHQRDDLDLPADVGTVAALAHHLEGHYPELSGRLDTVRFAVNETIGDASQTLADGDVVALIPPVSGG